MPCFCFLTMEFSTTSTTENLHNQSCVLYACCEWVNKRNESWKNAVHCHFSVTGSYVIILWLFVVGFGGLGPSCFSLCHPSSVSCDFVTMSLEPIVTSTAIGSCHLDAAQGMLLFHCFLWKRLMVNIQQKWCFDVMSPRECCWIHS